MTEVAWGPVGREVFERTYRRTMADGAPEEWYDTAARVAAGNTELVEGTSARETARLYELIRDMDMLPAGRHLWVSGVPGRQFLFNCHRAGWTPNLADHVCFVFDELMKGGGIGANYSNEYVERVKPVLHGIEGRMWIHCDERHPDFGEVVPDVTLPEYYAADRFIVQDSREGWVEALRYLARMTQHKLKVVFDVSKVRRRGSEIKGFGGTASGPGPLADMLRSVAEVITQAEGRRLSALELMQIDHEISRCVIAGNVRRSARMSIMHWRSPDIFEFINCKADHANHWTTNISVEIDDHFLEDIANGEGHAEAVLDAVLDGMLLNGEPGFYNSSLASEGELQDVRSTNPCGEIALEEWENCNLGHLNMRAHVDSFDDLAVAAVLMTRFLIRATYGDIGDPKQAEVVARNRRIGVGLFGFQEWCIARHGVAWSQAWQSEAVREELERLRDIVRGAAAGYAFELRIPAPIKTTTVAPTGSIAKMPGTSEGVHPIYAKWFVRRVRYAADDPALVELEERGLFIEDCIYSDNTKVVSFICRDPIFDHIDPSLHHLVESVDEIELEDALRVQAMVQECWADNAVSFTVNVREGDVSHERLRAALVANLGELKGTTIMVDGTRPQAPYERITEDQYDSTLVHDVGQALDDCATGACPIR